MEEIYDNEEDFSFTCPNTYESDRRDFDKERKAARFFVKAKLGVLVGIAKGKRFRWWTLTESDESIAASINFSHSWSMMRKWLKRLDEHIEWCLVEHIQGDLRRRNWHVLTCGDNRLPVLEMREYWQSHFLSTITGLQEVKNPIKSASYLAGYLGGDDKFQKARFSQNWVFPYWWEFSRFYKKEQWEYPSNEELVRLTLSSFEERRETNMWFDLFIDIRKIGWDGVIAEVNEKWEAILRPDKVAKKKENIRTKRDYNGRRLELL